MRAAMAFVLMLIAGCVSTGPVTPSEPFNPPAAYWLSVPCDVVAQAHLQTCVAEHERAGIPASKSMNTARQEKIAEASAGETDNFTPAPESSVPLGQEHGLSSPVRSCYASSGYRPIIDTQGVDAGKLECDLSDCQAYAAQINPVQNAVSNAMAGAILGALFGLAIGDHGWAARAGAQGGAVGGALGGAGGAAAAQTNVVRNCMAGRGYRVLQ